MTVEILVHTPGGAVEACDPAVFRALLAAASAGQELIDDDALREKVDRAVAAFQRVVAREERLSR